MLFARLWFVGGEAASLSSNYLFQLKKTHSVWLSDHHRHSLHGAISVNLQETGFLSLFFSLGVLLCGECAGFVWDGDNFAVRK